MGKKFVIYLKDSQKAITITDPNENRSIHELRGPVSASMSGIEICHFETDSDCLLLKPDSIVGIWIEDLNKSRGKTEEILNLDDLELDIPVPENEISAEVPQELDDDDLSVDDNIGDLLNDLEKEEEEFEKIISSISETVNDTSPYNPNIPKFKPTPNPVKPVKTNIHHTVEIPEHMIAIPEESDDADVAGSDLLNSMGVKKVEPKHIPMVGEQKPINKEKMATNVVNAASKNKNVVSVKSVRINK